MSDATRLRVDLGARGYDIVVGSGLLAEAGRHLAPVLRQPRVAVLTDRTVARHWLATLAASLDAAGIAWHAIEIEPGEGSKDFRHLEQVIDALLAARIERGTTLLALGGGVVGDLGGFAASIVLRGIDCVQLPTTLLAQVDSAIGGKTGIDTSAGKNLVGSFHQPRLVLADLDTLRTLPQRQLLAGYAEVVKYGLIADAAFFAWLERHGAALLAGDAGLLRHAVAAACAAKAAIVVADEREAGRRALLNLGHTFGHALEAEYGYSDQLLHGEAVAIGMVLAFDLSARLGLCPAEDAGRVRRHLAQAGLPAGPAALGRPAADPARLVERMHGDKKVSGGRLGLVLARGIGQAFLARDVDAALVRNLLLDALAA